MKKFEIGKTYFDRYACDHNAISTITVIGRSAKMITFERDGQTRRAKIYTDDGDEYIMPDHYSMACVYCAGREMVNGTPNDEITPAAEPEQGTAATTDAVVIMPGTMLTCNCGAMYPETSGIVVGFRDIPATPWTAAHTAAVVLWADKRLETVALADIHPRGWRTGHGSPIGIHTA